MMKLLVAAAAAVLAVSARSNADAAIAPPPFVTIR